MMHSVMASVAGVLTALAGLSGSLQQTPSPPGSEQLSAEFLRLVPNPLALVKLSTGHRFVEGPTWLKDENALVFSDIPKSQQHLLAYPPAAGAAATTRPFRTESYWANGTTLDPQGRLVVCQQSARSVIRIGIDGKETVLADRFEGKKFNAPNDAVYTHDGVLIFTDPPYGPTKKPQMEMDHCGVYRLGPDGKVTELVADMKAPNGVALSPDDSTLYVSDTGMGSPGPVRAYTLTKDGKAIDGRLFYSTPKGAPDGMRTDSAGNLWTSAGDGVHIVAPDGKLIGIIKVPETPANLTFGGPGGGTLFITAQHSVYAIETAAKASR